LHTHPSGGHSVLPSVHVAPATRTVRNIPTEMALTADEDGMPQDAC
jgi:mRNA-degrading endonuclease toxin of MazEF toxin-antitoxin module